MSRLDHSRTCSRIRLIAQLAEPLFVVHLNASAPDCETNLTIRLEGWPGSRVAWVVSGFVVEGSLGRGFGAGRIQKESNPFLFHFHLTGQLLEHIRRLLLPTSGPFSTTTLIVSVSQ